MSHLSRADFSRNIGLLTEEQQSRLAAASVAVCGVGGMGGVAAEGLVRMGVGRILLSDFDSYEPTDVNRQIHCTQRTLGRAKTQVVAERLLEINPGLSVEEIPGVDATTVERTVAGADLLVNTMDQLRPSLLVERAARRHEKSVVSSWVTPYASVFVTRPSGPTWEEYLDFPTRGKPVEDVTDADVRESFRRETQFTLRQFRPFDIVTRELAEDVIEGRAPVPSLVPIVWLCGTLIANEAMKILTNQGRQATHWGVFFDQYDFAMHYFDASGVAE